MMVYQITTSGRSGTLTVTDAPGHVRLTLKFDRYGLLGDEVSLEREIKRVLAQLGRDADALGCDPRRIVLSVPDVGGRSLFVDGREQ